MTRLTCLVVAIVNCCCGYSTTHAQDAATVQSKLDKYFERYCDYTGGLGIGHDASHTYDYTFRQRLKGTKDAELKRLFVLQHLYRELDHAMGDYQRGEIRVGKAEYRKMTPAEMEKARKALIEMLDDLAEFDPEDPLQEIAESRYKLK